MLAWGALPERALMWRVNPAEDRGSWSYVHSSVPPGHCPWIFSKQALFFGFLQSPAEPGKQPVHLPEGGGVGGGGAGVGGAGPGRTHMLAHPDLVWIPSGDRLHVYVAMSQA